MSIKIFRAGLLWGLLLGCGSGCLMAAEAGSPLKAFGPNSFESIQTKYQGKPFMLALWSLDCPPCFKELNNLARWKRNHPGLNLVVVATDDYSMKVEVSQQIKAFGLEQADNWIFSEHAAVRLRYNIDPYWHGELPRSYLYDRRHSSTAISGLLKDETIQQWVGFQ